MICKLLLALLFMASAAVTAGARVAMERTAPASTSPNDEVLYLPSGPGLQFMSFGYRNALAQLLWFNTISYFGKHFRGDQNYQWLSHMCGLVTTLNPYARHVYEFCGLMLAWECNQPKASTALLSEAIAAEPNYWNYYYLRGIVRMIFLGEGELAKDDFVSAAKLPGAHRLVARLAAKKLAMLESSDTAIEFLRELLDTTTDPAMRATLERRLEQIQNGTMPMEKRGVSPLQHR